MANQSFFGSICLTDLIEKAKQFHPAFSKSEKNGKVYVNITVWHNEQEDKYGNIMSIQLSEKKDQRQDGKAFYLGNLKKSEYKEPAPLSQKDTGNLDIPSNIPSREKSAPENLNSVHSDDLPF